MAMGGERWRLRRGSGGDPTTEAPVAAWSFSVNDNFGRSVVADIKLISFINTDRSCVVFI
jgi:hypothetical protein